MPIPNHSFLRHKHGFQYNIVNQFLRDCTLSQSSDPNPVGWGGPSERIARLSANFTGGRVATFLQFLLVILTTFPVVGTDLAPLTDLDSDHANYHIQWGDAPYQEDFHLVYEPDRAVVLYQDQLLTHHQLVSISRVLDFTDISLANFNTEHSLSNFQQAKVYDEFLISGDAMYMVTYNKFSHDQCLLHCATHDGGIVNTPLDFHRLQEFKFAQVWVKAHIVIDDPDKGRYSLYLENTLLYPENTFTNSGNPRIFYQENREIKEIGDIKTFYSSYYDSQSENYWPVSAYNLNVAISSNGDISIFLPLPATILPLEAMKVNCACKKTLKTADRIANEVKNNYRKVLTQIRSQNLSIEPLRIEELNGNVKDLLAHKRGPRTHRVLKTYVEDEIAPLSFPKKHPPQPLMGPVAGFVARTVAAPMLKTAFLSYLNKFSGRTKAILRPFLNSSSLVLPKQVSVTGLQAHVTNFSIILSFDELPEFETNISGINLDKTRNLLQTLALTNDEFIDFLRDKAYDMIIGLAAREYSSKN